jgi:protein involved in polysaccharide export with SLBB domain
VALVAGLLTQPIAAQSAAAPPAGAAASPSPASGGQSQSSGSAAPAPAALAMPATAAPSLSSGTLPAPGSPTAGGPPPVVVQYPPATITAYDGTTAALYGSSLFTGAFAGSTVTTLSDYQVQIGDTIEVKTFGNMSLDVVARVDTSGKLFLPIIGPVTLAGVTRAQLNATLQSAVGAVYTNTRVYADIVQPGSVGVYVTGLIQRPGRYLGATTDDLLYFLDKAGGIDGLRGSFRDVLIRHRDGREEHVDLYGFLSEGRTGSGRFADGDTVVVRPRGPQVVVTGMALQPYAFELKLPPGVMPSRSLQAGYSGSVAGAGAQVLELAQPNGRLVTGAYVRSVRNAVPTSSYLPFGQFAGVSLGDGDHVDFRSDAVAQTIAVTVQVTQPVPSVFVVARTATLQDVLTQIPQTSPTADYRSVYILRRSVAAQQKTELTAALLRLQQDALAATALNVASQSGSAQAASLLPQFVQAASQSVPNGQIAVYRNDRFDNLHLQDGDQIVIPEKSDVVQVAGEALNPGGFAYRPGIRAADYIRDAGGFSSAADKHKFVLKKPNGVAEVIKGDAVPEPGDLILVVPHVSGRTFQAIQSITSLLLPATVAIAALSK